MGQEYSSPVPEPTMGKGVFTAFRHYGVWPTLYPSHKTAVSVDVLEAGLILAFVILGFCFYLILPGFRGWKGFYTFIRVTVSLFLGASVILCNWGQNWEVSSIETATKYKSFSKETIHAEVGIKIGLRNVNITLKGNPVNQINETIDYNERFWWSFPWTQGRIGFGPYSQTINQEFREAQYKGLPYPILWIAEYFTIDGEGIRWGRHYKTAGWYTHIMLWSAFACWILANIMYFLHPRYGGLMSMTMGALMLIGNICWAVIRNANELVIPFEDGFLELKYAWCFWLNLVAGLLSVAIGVAMVVLDYFLPDALATFFGFDGIKDYEEYYPEPTEAKETHGSTYVDSQAVELQAGTSNGHIAAVQPIPVFRKRGPTTVRNRTMKPTAALRQPKATYAAEGHTDEEEVNYENMDFQRNAEHNDQNSEQL